MDDTHSFISLSQGDLSYYDQFYCPFTSDDLSTWVGVDAVRSGLMSSHNVKSESSGLKSDGGLEGRRKVSMNWTRGLMKDNGKGDLVRTWHRLICCTLAEVVCLISEQQRFRG